MAQWLNGSKELYIAIIIANVKGSSLMLQRSKPLHTRIPKHIVRYLLFWINLNKSHKEATRYQTQKRDFGFVDYENKGIVVRIYHLWHLNWLLYNKYRSFQCIKMLWKFKQFLSWSASKGGSSCHLARHTFYEEKICKSSLWYR